MSDICIAGRQLQVTLVPRLSLPPSSIAGFSVKSKTIFYTRRNGSSVLSRDGCRATGKHVFIGAERAIGAKP